MLDANLACSHSKQVRLHIDEALYVLSRQYGRTLLLIDRFVGDTLASSIQTLTVASPKRLVLDDPLFENNPGMAPLLVELLHSEPTHHDLLRESVLVAQEESREIFGAHSVCGWLFSGATLAQMRHALQLRLDVQYPSGERRYLRYFDPRVLPRMLALLATEDNGNKPAPAGPGALLGPVRTWCHLDQNGRLLRHDNLEPYQRSSARMRFDERTAGAVDRIEAINMTIRALTRHAVCCDLPNNSVIDANLVAAQALGLAYNEDLVAYAWRAIFYGRPFAANAILRELASKATTNGIPFDAMVSESFPFPCLNISTAGFTAQEAR